MSRISDFVGKSAVENVEAALLRAKQSSDYNIFLHLCEEKALKRAKKIDTGDSKGRLAGVPFVVKDNFTTKDAPTTAASEILEGFYSPIQATAVSKLEAEDAICIGKANLDAFAHGGSTENSAYGPTLNAKDKERVAGGSSGGSAVAVALDIVPFALGTDTGGSIRQPASLNGVVGFKPTYGTVSRYGVVAMASSTDVIGPIANNVEDIQTVMSVIAGKDENDMTTLPDLFEPLQETSGKKIGVVKQFMDESADSDVLQVTRDYIEKLKSLGHTVEEVDLPLVKQALAMYYVIVPAEISSNLARYDGVRYGKRSKLAKTIGEVYGKSRDEGFVDENKRRIIVGSFVLSSGFFDAYYLQAQKARTLLINQLEDLFSRYDFLVGPTAPTPAFKLGENTKDPIRMYLADIMTVPASLAGLPAISVPFGQNQEGLPIGVQVMASRRGDAELLRFAQDVEEK